MDLSQIHGFNPLTFSQFRNLRQAAQSTNALPRAFVLGQNLISWSAKKQAVRFIMTWLIYPSVAYYPNFNICSLVLAFLRYASGTL